MPDTNAGYDKLTGDGDAIRCILGSNAGETMEVVHKFSDQFGRRFLVALTDNLPILISEIEFNQDYQYEVGDEFRAE